MNADNVRKAEGAKKQEDSSSKAERINVKNNKEVKPEEVTETKKIEIKSVQTKAHFAVDDNENVVIRIVDSEGKLISQIPPEEYLKAAELLRDINKNIFSVEV